MSKHKTGVKNEWKHLLDVMFMFFLDSSHRDQSGSSTIMANVSSSQSLKDRNNDLRRCSADNWGRVHRLLVHHEREKSAVINRSEPLLRSTVWTGGRLHYIRSEYRERVQEASIVDFGYITHDADMTWRSKFWYVDRREWQWSDVEETHSSETMNTINNHKKHLAHTLK